MITAITIIMIIKITIIQILNPLTLNTTTTTINDTIYYKFPTTKVLHSTSYYYPI